MFGSLLPGVDRLPFGRWCCLAVLAGCLGISGCTNLNLRGDSFPDNGLSNLAGQIRGGDQAAHSDAFSNKARQIDMNLGGSRPGFSPVIP